ncbi:hypothetical protein COO60DRAFT_550570 [Scenedesmus sp. NREL 46B-D3]|nr:hypothetical protein COO60DRAFT_550570 [Scenedesmus sp. NREL 46B-D3]
MEPLVDLRQPVPLLLLLVSPKKTSASADAGPVAALQQLVIVRDSEWQRGWYTCCICCCCCWLPSPNLTPAAPSAWRLSHQPPCRTCPCEPTAAPTRSGTQTSAAVCHQQAGQPIHLCRVPASQPARLLPTCDPAAA